MPPGAFDIARADCAAERAHRARAKADIDAISEEGQWKCKTHRCKRQSPKLGATVKPGQIAQINCINDSRRQQRHDRNRKRAQHPQDMPRDRALCKINLAFASRF